MTRLISNWVGLTHYRDIDVINIDQVDEFKPTDIYHIYDVFDIDRYNQLFAIKGVPGHIIGDHWSYLDWKYQDRFLSVPAWTVNELARYSKFDYPNVVTTQFCCNVIANKKQINRYLAFKLAELFDLNFSYTWSGIGRQYDMAGVLDELNTLGAVPWLSANDKSFLLGPINLPQQWIEFPGAVGSDDDGRVKDFTNEDGATWPWVNGLNKLFYNSAVSLITESVEFQHGAIFTEKTGYSALGLTFPLWIGGYKQAQHWEQLGFDIFADVINHDYQHYNTLIERCWWAVVLNLDILKDIKLAQHLRQQHMTRLLKNREKILNGTLTKTLKIMTNLWPKPADIFIQRAYQLN